MKTLKHSFKVGMSFGLTSGIITTLGLIVGLHSGTHSKLAVIGGILTIAIADAFSDALGIHMSEESEARHSSKEIWESTVSTFLFKFIFALTFIIPVTLFDLTTAIITSVIWGIILIGFFSYSVAREQEKLAWKTVLEHLIIVVTVVVTAHLMGEFISSIFG
ncbi:hypothetical protein KEJ27_04340 [Candidatus Bathyarchaeota archaeon]|nr:hypothetical protein [Candidatus Bathyarchaeota archaeon]MBS7613351.1 hypothetical protein [Candidatus Bathyarchaeota archaeon]